MGLATVKASGDNAVLFGPAIGYEKSIGDHISLNFHADLSYHNKDDAVYDKHYNRNFDLEGALRYFPDKSLNGIFFGPYVSYGVFEQITKIGNSTGKGSDSYFRIGASGGYQTYLNDRLNLYVRALLGTAFQEESMKGSLSVGIGYSLY